MRLVYITEYFHTPAEGGLMRTWELSKYLADQGHQVSVIAPAAHHMTGRLPDDFKGLRQVQDVAGIRVIKVRTAAGFRRGYTARLLYYLTTPVVSVLAALGERPDVVMASSPPFFLGPFAWLYARLRRVPLVVEVRDAWLEFAVAKGLVPRHMVSFLTAWQDWLFRRAARIVAVTPGIRDLAVARLGGDPQKKVLLVMNGFEEDVFAQFNSERAAAIGDRWGLHGKFVCVYAGTLGMARDCLVFVRAAERLQDLEDIVFVFLGEGERKLEMQEYVRSHRVRNCLFIPVQPRRDIPCWYSLCSVGLNSIRAGEALESSLSNKIFDYMGAGLPVVFSGSGDTTEFIERSGGGIAVGPEDDAAMASAIRRLHNDPDLYRRLSEAGRAYVIRNFSRRKLVEPLDRMLRALAGEPSRLEVASEP